MVSPILKMTLVPLSEVPEGGAVGTGKWESLRAAVSQLHPNGDALCVSLVKRKDADNVRSAATNLQPRRLVNRTPSTHVRTRGKAVDPQDPGGAWTVWIWLEDRNLQEAA